MRLFNFLKKSTSGVVKAMYLNRHSYKLLTGSKVPYGKFRGLDNVRIYAINAHWGQMRKYTGEHYFFHLESMASAIYRDMINRGDLYKYGMSYQYLDPRLVTAWLHDIVEDTTTETISSLDRYIDIGMLTDMDIVENVRDLTDTDKSKGSRAFRKNYDSIRSSHWSDVSRIVKLYDIQDNLKNIIEYEPGFAKVACMEYYHLLLHMAVDMTKQYNGSVIRTERPYIEMSNKLMKTVLDFLLESLSEKDLLKCKNFDVSVIINYKVNNHLDWSTKLKDPVIARQIEEFV